jgi:c-di-GMP-binding flagellar brake protein YcgR
MAENDRRQHPRIPMRVQTEVRFTSWAVYSLIYTINISKGGMNLELTEEPKADAKLTVRLRQPDGSAVDLEAVVRHTQQTKSGRWSVGVQFTSLGAVEKQAIERAITAHGGSLQAHGLTPRGTK